MNDNMTKDKEPLRIAYIVSVRRGISSFTYREINELIYEDLEITLFPTKYKTGPYMPNDNMDVYKYHPVFTIVVQLLFFLNPIRYIKAFITAIGTRSFIDFLIAVDFSFQMKKKGINQIHCEFGDHKLFIGYYCKKLLNIPLTVKIHAHELYINPNWDMFKKSLVACDNIFTVSDWNKAILINKFKIPADRIIINRQFIDTNIFSPDTSKRILIVAFFEKRKGFDTLFEAIKKLQDYDIKIWIVGHGDVVSESDRINPKKLSEKLQIEDRVVIFGRVSDEVLRTLYNACDIFVLPSKTMENQQMEGIPATLMEAMAFGKPVISTRHAGIPEMVEKILVEEDNVNELAEAIELLINNPTLCQKLGERNREIIRERYSKNNVNELKRFFMENNLVGK